tara:strand:- start:1882 stop:2100 length:219 start_codon:yes stop_codon:yes gene_type:complete
VKTVFVLVISLWGHNGAEWEYVGNQSVLKSDLSAAECMALGSNFETHNQNEYYHIRFECYNKETQELLDYNT